MRVSNVPYIGTPVKFFFDYLHYPLALGGVELFFVLSGFLIGNILIRTFVSSATFSFSEVRNFWVRRWFRTLPLFWLILTTEIILYKLMDLRSHEMPKSLFYVFLQNIWYPHPQYFFGEAWSLSVEEWFYLTLPVAMCLAAVIFKPKNKQAFLLKVFAGYVLTFVAIRFINAFHPINGPDQDSGIRKVVLFRLDAVMYGVLMAYFNYYYPAALHKLKNYLLAVGLAGIVVLSWLVISDKIHIMNAANPALRFASDAFLYLLLPLFFSFWLPYANSVTQLRNKYALGFFTHISKISYSMYLVHFSLIFIPFFIYMKQVPPHTAALLYLLYWAIVIGLSTTLYKYFEYPVMRLRERFSKKER